MHKEWSGRYFQMYVFMYMYLFIYYYFLATKVKVKHVFSLSSSYINSKTYIDSMEVVNLFFNAAGITTKQIEYNFD